MFFLAPVTRDLRFCLRLDDEKMNKLISNILFAAIFLSCGSVRSQEKQLFLEEQFSTYLATLDSVASGKKRVQHLTHDQSAFLYLIDAWNPGSSKWDFQGLPLFTSESVQKWKEWSNNNLKQITLEDFDQAMTLYRKAFREGSISDDELEILEDLSKKYQRFH